MSHCLCVLSELFPAMGAHVVMLILLVLAHSFVGRTVTIGREHIAVLIDEIDRGKPAVIVSQRRRAMGPVRRRMSAGAIIPASVDSEPVHDLYGCLKLNGRFAYLHLPRHDFLRMNRW